MSLDLRLRAHLWGFGVGDESMKLGLELVAAMKKLHYSPMTKPNTQPQHSHGATRHDSGCSVRAFLN